MVGPILATPNNFQSRTYRNLVLFYVKTKGTISEPGCRLQLQPASCSGCLVESSAVKKTTNFSLVVLVNSKLSKDSPRNGRQIKDRKKWGRCTRRRNNAPAFKFWSLQKGFKILMLIELRMDYLLQTLTFKDGANWKWKCAFCRWNKTQFSFASLRIDALIAFVCGALNKINIEIVSQSLSLHR